MGERAKSTPCRIAIVVESAKVTYTYDVKFEESNPQWATR